MQASDEDGSCESTISHAKKGWGITTHFTDMCIRHFFLASERRSTQAWLQNLAPFQVFINTQSVIQDKTLTIYIDLY